MVTEEEEQQLKSNSHALLLSVRRRRGMRVYLFVYMYVAARQYFHCPPGNTGIRFEVIFISFLYAICMLE